MRIKVLLKIITFCAILSTFTACTNSKTNRKNHSHNSQSVAAQMTANPTNTIEPAQVTKINITQKEMMIQLSPATAPAGLIEFIVKNEGKKPHELVIFKNNLVSQQLPVKAGTLDEASKGLKHVGVIDQSKLKSGTTQTLQLNLTPGRYLLVCNQPGHVQAGMKAELIVK